MNANLSLKKEALPKKKETESTKKISFTIIGLVSMLIAVCLIVPAVAQPTSVFIYGSVFDTNGQPLNGPNVSIMNINTSEHYTVETNESSNYYQVITSSWNVSAGNVLRFNASDNGNSKQFNHSVTSDNMANGGLFEQNISLSVTYTISGYTFKENGDPENNATVKVINLNNSKNWDGTTSPADNVYELTLTPGEDVNASETFRIIAKSMVDDGSMFHPENATYYINVTYHGVESAPGVESVNLTLNEFCIHYDYPYEVQEQWNYSGAAVMEMWTYFKNITGYNQTQLQAMGRANNSNLSRPDYVDPKGIARTLIGIIPVPAGHTFGTYATSNPYAALHEICIYQWTGPGALPTYGYYANWMAVRGMHTDKDPHGAGGYNGYNISGFWINDPNSTGIGENSYKTIDEWLSTYYKLITDPYNTYYNNKYVSMFEPPEHEADVGIVSSPARFNTEAKQAVQAARAKQVPAQGCAGGSRTMAELGDAVEEANKWIVQAAIDGVNEQLAPYDDEFATVFKDVIAENPVLTKSDTGDYYLVPFNNETGTLVVIIVDAEDGHFKEASWVKNPVDYLPVSEEEAIEIVGKPNVTADLLYQGQGSYYPVWRISHSSGRYFVNQQHELFDVEYCGDVDGDGYTNIYDGQIVAGAAGIPLTRRWAADVDCNNLTNIHDGQIIAGAVGIPKNCCVPGCD
jgi:hypothetical protein